ncbi:hypothetical protein CCP2SC5_30058 [Azospirillaceae bacterium]
MNPGTRFLALSKNLFGNIDILSGQALIFVQITRIQNHGVTRGQI